MTKLCQIWIEECEIAMALEAELGTDHALDYLIGEKFLDFLKTAETDLDFRAELINFVAEIKTLFERWQLAEYLKNARQTEPFDPSIYEDQETAEIKKWADIRRCTADLLLVESAKDWLLGDEE